MNNKVVIIGGVAAGPKVAAKLRRMDPEVEITIIEKGKFLSYAGCGLPYYVSGEIKEYRELMETPIGVMRDPEFFEKTKRIKVLNRTEALRIDRENKRVELKNLESGEISDLPYDYLVLATGAKVSIPPVEAVDLNHPEVSLSPIDLAHVYTLHGVEDAEAIRWTIKEKLAKRAVIIGGGLIGMEMAESLAKSGLEITILEVLPEILPILDEDMGILVRRYCQSEGVNIRVGEGAQHLEGEEGVVKRVITDKGSYEADMVVIATGFKPNDDLARKAGLEVGERGGIKVDLFLRTSDPFIYAAGDCIEIENLVCGQPAYIPMGSLANKQGRVVAMNLVGRNEVFRGALNSVIFKVFDYTVARSGLGVKQAQNLGYDVEYALVPAPDRAHYFPGAKQVIIKLVADRRSGRVLGAQMIGKGEVTKSIYALATLLNYQGKVEDISNLDLPYAPPYASAIDNLCLAANVLRNKLEGSMVGISPQEVERRRKQGEDFILLDVRTPREYQNIRIPGSILIPLAELPARVNELSPDKDIITICAAGLRSYEASLILKSKGFGKVMVMDGGMAAWPYEIER